MSRRRLAVGEIRPTQMLFSYGVGSLVDLPRISVLVLGLDDWDQAYAEVVQESRLLNAVRRRLGGQVQALRSPPRPRADDGPPTFFKDADQLVGAGVATFPRWMVCPRCRTLTDLNDGRFKLKENPVPDRVHYYCAHCAKGKNPDVVPARFLVACKNGHVDDFPWSWFIHGGKTNCPGTLQLLEMGASGEARDVIAKCQTCDAKKAMALAFGEQASRYLPACRARRVHLKDTDPHGCDQEPEAILMGASNMWFADSLPVLSIPDAGDAIDAQVEEFWTGELEKIEDVNVLGVLLGMDRYRRLSPHGVEKIWAAMVKRRTRGSDDARLDLKVPEWEVFKNPDTAPKMRDFELREEQVPAGFEDVIESVVLAERLREVRALLGFTRLDPPAGEEWDFQTRGDRRTVPLTRSPPTWVPASEVRGEGIFLRLREDAVAQWLEQVVIAQRSMAFLASHIAWRNARGLRPPDGANPGLRFVLLHTLAHVLMRQLSMECGYSAASLRERIYSRDPDQEGGPMAGILIYTATPDSEGTLGGLVSLGRPEELGRHLATALVTANLCASDPLCAERPPTPDGRTIHAAACHACLFVSETSCEAGNRYLDRNVLSDTVNLSGLSFFPPIHE